MTHKKQRPEPVYLPSNEPYLGREAVHQFDVVIMSCMELNSDIAAYTRNIQLSGLQKAACQIIPQGINLALTIRELVRQGYLFGALVLMRPLIERAATISYLHSNPDEIKAWENGWQYRERPSLSKMLDTMSGGVDTTLANQLCTHFNHIVHGDPIGSEWNLVRLSDSSFGYSVGKVTNVPELCDEICIQSFCYLIVLMGMMTACFPDTPRTKAQVKQGPYFSV